MADTFDEAGNQIDQQGQSLLAAIAQYGSQGRAFYDRALQDLQAQRGTAVQAALHDAAVRGAPQGLMDQESTRISDPYNRYSADLTAGQAMRSIGDTTRQANLASYFGQAKAAIPAMRSIAENKLAQIKAQQAQDQFKNSLEVQRLNLEAQRLANSASGGSSARPRYSSGLANSIESRAADLYRADIVKNLRASFGDGSRTEDKLQQLIADGDKQKSLSHIDSLVKSGYYWSGTGPRGLDASGKPKLDARVLRSYVNQWYSQPSNVDDYRSKAHDQLLAEGGY